MQNSAIDKLLRLLERTRARFSLPAREDRVLVMFEPTTGAIGMPLVISEIPPEAKFGPKLYFEDRRVAVQGQPEDVDAVRTLDWMIGRMTRKFNAAAVPDRILDKIAAHADDLRDPISRVQARLVNPDASSAEQQTCLVYTHAFTGEDGQQGRQPLLTVNLSRS
jgi:hypothetical protein